jgi:hypothetical protein
VEDLYELFSVATPQKYATQLPSTNAIRAAEQTMEILFLSPFSSWNLLFLSLIISPLVILYFRVHCRRPRSTDFHESNTKAIETITEPAARTAYKIVTWS